MCCLLFKIVWGAEFSNTLFVEVVVYSIVEVAVYMMTIMMLIMPTGLIGQSQLSAVVVAVCAVCCSKLFGAQSC